MLIFLNTFSDVDKFIIKLLRVFLALKKFQLKNIKKKKIFWLKCVDLLNKKIIF